MENDLLLVFIGLVAVALVVIATGVALVAWRLVVFITELTIVTRRLHEAGELVAENVADLRTQFKNGKFVYSLAKLIWPKKTTPRKSLPPQE